MDSFLSPRTVSSTRAVGNALESLVADKFDTLVGDWCDEYLREFSRRAMADMAFTDVEGICSYIDVKTHRQDTQFNRPNLTSVERLARLYESDKNVFSLIMIKYSIDGASLKISDVLFSPIEFLDWDCLTVGVLGWGQIQIADSNDIRTREKFSRKQWMLQLCDVLMEYYPREIGKIKERVRRFEEVRAYWDGKEDV